MQVEIVLELKEMKVGICKYGIVALVVVAVHLGGCDTFRHKRQSGIAAELNGETLSSAELWELTSGLDAEDSARVAEQYIRQWATDILQYEKAAGYKSAETEAMVEEYRRSLYMHEYEQHLLSQMPQTVHDTLVEQFYEAHKKEFVLTESMVKGILIVFPNGAPHQDKLRKWLGAHDEENMEKIEKYAYQNATGYELFTDDWRSANQILLRLPSSTDILQEQLKKHALIEVQDSVSTYWLQVTDKRVAGELMPIDMARNDIKKIILTERQKDYLDTRRRALYEDALRSKKLKIYEENN